MVYGGSSQQQALCTYAQSNQQKTITFCNKPEPLLPGPSTTEEPYDGSGDDGEDKRTSEAPRQGCRADDVVTCPEDSSVRICEVQLCDGHPDCPRGYDEHNCTVGRSHRFFGRWCGGY